MSIRPSPLLGYNNNVRHRGKIFHIQTEDSGARYGHIMTHLFTDGGRILKSVKTSYAEYIGNERMGEIVREMMKQQHKAMFIALRDGKFDSAADLPGEAPPPSAPFGGYEAAPASEGRAPPSGTFPHRPAAIPPPLPGAREPSPAPPPAVPARGSPEDIALDVDALERAAAVDSALPAQRSSSDLPPPPSDLLREKTNNPSSGSMPVAARRPLPAMSGAERRYAPTRPASIFGQARPQQGKSVFGEDVIDDQSLDEVILSFLADDLAGPIEDP